MIIMDMKENKIAFVIPSMAEGGMEASVLRIGGFLKKNGYLVTIITTEKPGQWFYKIHDNGLNAKHISGLNKWFPYAHVNRVGKAISDENYDVVFIAFDRFLQAALSILNDRVNVIPLLRNDHDDVYRVGLANKDKWNIALGNSPKIVEIAKQKVTDRPIALIPNGIHISETLNTRVKYDSKKPFKIAFVGRLINESKGIFLLPEIVKRCSDKGMDFTLTVAGEGIDKNELIQKFTKYNLNNKINLIGMVTKSEVEQLLYSSDILLFTSYYEGLPNVVLEAQACGCIPIASRLSGITDFLIKEGVTGILVESGDVEGFSEAILQLANSPARILEMSNSAKLFMSENFSDAAEGKKYVELISDLLRGSFPLKKTRKDIKAFNFSLFPIRNLYQPYLRKLKRFIRRSFRLPSIIRILINEYITNSIIANTPSIFIRSIFYRKILNIIMDHTVNIQMGCYIYNSNGYFRIGENSVINRGCTLDRRGGLDIGSRVNISAEAAIYTAGHNIDSPGFFDYLKPVVLEDYVWVGTRAMVMPGVTIGRGAVVLPGAVVTRNVAPFKIVGGIPAKVIGERAEYINYNPAWYPLFQ